MERIALSIAFVALSVGCQPRAVVVSGGETPPDAAAPSPDAGPAGTSSLDAPSGAPDAGFAVSWPEAGASSGPPDAGADRACGQSTFKLERRPAELMLVLDRSGSMNDPAGLGANTKWTDVTAALDETMLKTDATVQWGVKLFPSDDVPCHVAEGVESPSAPHNYSAVTGQIAKATPSGDGTPTTLAIQQAVAYVTAHPSPNPRYLVVATDGEPNCRVDGGRVGARDEPGAIMAVADALRAGLKTFVIGVATGPDAGTTLDQMASAGGMPRNGTPLYYPVTSRADLVAALDVITALVTDCNFPLATPPPSPDDVAVDVGGTRVSRDPGHTNGWDYGPGGTSVQLHGAACQRVKESAGQDVHIVFGCPGVVIF
jgi:hypothetical protein